MESFETILHGFSPLKYVPKLSIVDVCGDPDYVIAKQIDPEGL